MPLEALLEAPLAVEEMAARVGVPRRSLEQRFERTLGRSPMAAYVAMRLDQAALLLASSDQTIAAIAAATGFCDTSHFSRVFKQHRGTTPAWYRDAVRSAESTHREIVDAAGPLMRPLSKPLSA